VFTPDGYDWLARRLAEAVEGGWIIISDGAGQSFPAPIATIEIQEEDDKRRVLLSAEVGENDANFEWAKRSVKLTDGTVIDTDESDGGRKAQGAVWHAEVAFDL
jgi:hypothetical protein